MNGRRRLAVAVIGEKRVTDLSPVLSQVSLQVLWPWTHFQSCRTT